MPTVPSDPNRVAALFDALAPSYDNTGVDFFQPIADGLISVVAPRAGEDLLDIGCGRGAVLLSAAGMVSPGRAVGIDISPAMVAFAEAGARERQLHNVSVHVDDAAQPSTVDAVYDVITSSLVLFFLNDPLAALHEWRELLKPGGRVGVTTFSVQDERWGQIDATLQPYLPGNDARTTGAEGPFTSDAGVEGLLAAAGYVDVRTVRLVVDVRFDSAEQWLAFSMSTGQRAAWQRIPEDSRASVREEALRRFDGFASQDGGVTFTQAVRHSLGYRPDA
jgi:ubiquinone/menaquinone biosynthesis C-methylase UbiE